MRVQIAGHSFAGSLIELGIRKRLTRSFIRLFTQPSVKSERKRSMFNWKVSSSFIWLSYHIYPKIRVVCVDSSSLTSTPSSSWRWKCGVSTRAINSFSLGIGKHLTCSLIHSFIHQSSVKSERYSSMFDWKVSSSTIWLSYPNLQYQLCVLTLTLLLPDLHHHHHPGGGSTEWVLERSTPLV